MAVCLSFTLAFTLMVMPLPELLRLIRPNLVILVMVYWLLRLPESIGIGGAFFLGFIYDGIIGSPLGLHALSFSLISAVLLLAYSRWRMFTSLQQALWLVLLLVLHQLLVNLGYSVIRRTELQGWMWVSALLGGLCWLGLNRMALSRH
jgi:rod shape-determining protein MreD